VIAIPVVAASEPGRAQTSLTVDLFLRKAGGCKRKTSRSNLGGSKEVESWLAKYPGIG